MPRPFDIFALWGLVLFIVVLRRLPTAPALHSVLDAAADLAPSSHLPEVQAKPVKVYGQHDYDCYEPVVVLHVGQTLEHLTKDHHQGFSAALLFDHQLQMDEDLLLVVLVLYSEGQVEELDGDHD